MLQNCVFADIIFVIVLQAGPALKRQSSGDSGGLAHAHPSLSRGASLDSPKVTLFTLRPPDCETWFTWFTWLWILVHLETTWLWKRRVDTAVEVLLTRRVAVRFFLLQSRHRGRCPESRFTGSARCRGSWTIRPACLSYFVLHGVQGSKLNQGLARLKPGATAANLVQASGSHPPWSKCPHCPLTPLFFGRLHLKERSPAKWASVSTNTNTLDANTQCAD